MLEGLLRHTKIDRNDFYNHNWLQMVENLVGNVTVEGNDMNRCHPYLWSMWQTQLSRGIDSLSRNLKTLNSLSFTPKNNSIGISICSKNYLFKVYNPNWVWIECGKSTLWDHGKGGRYIFKPPHQVYEELPQNEDLTMKLADCVGIEVPLHGKNYQHWWFIDLFTKDSIDSKKSKDRCGGFFSTFRILTEKQNMNLVWIKWSL